MSKTADKGRVGEPKLTKSLSKIAANNESEKELEGNISDDDHMSNRIPESNIKANYQPAVKNVESEEADTGAKNSSQKPNKKETSSNPSGRNNQSKTNTAKLETQEQQVEEKPAQDKPKPQKLNINDPANLRKLIYSKSPKEAAEEYILSSRKKNKDQGSQTPLQKSVSSLGKNERTYPYGFNTGASPDKKDKQEDEKIEYDSAYTELAKKLYMERMHQQPQHRKIATHKDPGYGLLLSPAAAKEIENRKTIASKELQDSISARLMKQGDTLNEHNKALAEAYLQKEFEECTFTPLINENVDNRRSVKQFIEDQKKFVDLIEHKKTKIKQKIAAEQKSTEGTYKPELCKKSLKILEKKKKLTSATDEDVHSRLYKINKNAQQKQMQNIAQNEEVNLQDSNTSSQFIGQMSSRTSQKPFFQTGDIDATFVPNIHQKSKTIKRELKIDTILYNDAMRRKKKTITYEQKKSQKKSKGQGISDGSKRAYASRFIREFEAVILEFLQDEKEQRMDYLQLGEFLKKLFFLRDAEKVDNPQFTPERLLLYDTWYMLHADKFKGVHRRNLLVFLLAVLGLNFEITKIVKQDANETSKTNPIDIGDSDVKGSKHSSMIEKDNLLKNKGEVAGPPELDGIPPRERRIIGSFDEEENVELTDDDVEKIHRIFNVWFINRLGSKDNIGQIAVSKKYEEPSYQPEINEKSKNMAHLYREKILEGTSELIQQKKIEPPKDGKLTHADLLVLSKKIVKEKIEKFKASLEGNELRFCTFRPVTNDYSAKLQKRASEFDENDENPAEQKRNAASTGKNRAFELYSMRKPTTEKKDRNPHELEYEKHCDECTFQPDLTLTKLKKFEGGNGTIMAKNIEKTIQRLRYANEVREQKNLLNQRGHYPQVYEPSLAFSVERGSKRKSNGSLQKGSTEQKPSVSLHSKWLSKTSAPAKSGTSGRRNMSNNNQGDAQVVDMNGLYDYAGHDGEDGQFGEQYGGEKASEQLDHEEQEQQHSGEYEPDQDYNDGNEPGEGDNERVPLLFVDVNLGQGKSERIVVFEGDKSEVLAAKFAEDHGLDEVMAGKLKELLDSQIAGLLTRIDEELNSLHSEADKNDQQGNLEGYRYDEQIHEEEDDE